MMKTLYILFLFDKYIFIIFLSLFIRFCCCHFSCFIYLFQFLKNEKDFEIFLFLFLFLSTNKRNKSLNNRICERGNGFHQKADDRHHHPTIMMMLKKNPKEKNCLNGIVMHRWAHTHTKCIVNIIADKTTTTKKAILLKNPVQNNNSD